jgi:hypothetical protein
MPWPPRSTAGPAGGLHADIKCAPAGPIALARLLHPRSIAVREGGSALNQ